MAENHVRYDFWGLILCGYYIRTLRETRGVMLSRSGVLKVYISACESPGPLSKLLIGRVYRDHIPRPPNVPLLKALWSLLDGIWGVLKGSWGVLVVSALKAY